jgi:hypothetical protein
LSAGEAMSGRYIELLRLECYHCPSIPHFADQFPSKSEFLNGVFLDSCCWVKNNRPKKHYLRRCYCSLLTYTVSQPKTKNKLSWMSFFQLGVKISPVCINYTEPITF